MKTVNFGSITVDPRLVICQTKKISIVANLFQSKGDAFMAIPFDGRDLREHTLSDRLSLLQEAEELFYTLGLLSGAELLLNQGNLVGQTVPHLHIHSFVSDGNSPVLNWGQRGLPASVSFHPFIGEVPHEGQFNLYKRGKASWLLVPRGNSPKPEDNPRRGEVSPIIVDGKLLPEWKEKIENLRQLYHMP